MKNPLILLIALGISSCQPEVEKLAPDASSAEDSNPAKQEAEENIAVSEDIDLGNTESMVGQPFTKVKAALEKQDVEFRVLERDGESFPMTLDMRPDRLNFKIKDGLIIAVSKG